MRSNIVEAIEYIIDASAVDLNFDVSEFESVLTEFGLMIVPIEDPTNFFGDIGEVI